VLFENRLLKFGFNWRLDVTKVYPYNYSNYFYDSFAC